MEWISTKDRLPETKYKTTDGKLSERCVVLYRGFPHIAQYEKGDNHHTWYFPNNDDWFVGVTHWMALPELTK